MSANKAKWIGILVVATASINAFSLVRPEHIVDTGVLIVYTFKIIESV